jgi:uncharacterized protein YjbI with pentapeptide repeats
MPNDDLSDTNLDHANLSDTDMSAADLSDASLRSAQLKHTGLQDADLSGSNLHGAQLDHADLTGADLGNADFTDTSLIGVDLDQAANTVGITLAGATGLPDGMGERATAARWEGDTQGRGTGTGRLIVPDVERLLAALGRPDWVAEEPNIHLQPRLQQACTSAGSPWTLDGYLPSAAAYVVMVSWRHPGGNLHDLRADAFALLGTIAESVTFIHQTLTPTAVEYRIATGMLAEDGPFASHGHIILLRVGGPEVARLLRPDPHAIPGG